MPSFAQSLVTSLNAVNGGAALNGPTFLAIDSNRNIGGTTATWLYVAEHGNINGTGGGRILRYNLSTNATSANVVPVPAGTFVSPDGILVDAATGNLTIADRAQNKIVRISNTGTVLATLAAGQVHGPVELATDSAGNIYVAEHGDTAGVPGSNGSGFVSKWTSSGAFVWRSAAGLFAANNSGPYGVAVVGSSLYATDGYNSRVQVFDLNGNNTGQWPTTANSLPLGVYADSSGALWIAEATRSNDGSGAIQQVKKYTTAGAYANVTLTGGLSLPFDTVVNGTNAYVADYNNDRVAVFSLSSGGGGNGLATAPIVDAFYYNGSLTFRIHFSEPVTGVSANSFTIQTTGSVVSSISGVTQVDPSTYDIGITYNNQPPGSVAVSIKSSGSGITGQTSGMAYAGGGITMAVVPASLPSDTTAPAVSSFTAGTANGNTVPFTLTFNEGVYGVQASNFTINASSGATAQVVASGIVPTNAAGTVYTIPVQFSGTGSLTVTVSGGSIKDGNNNGYTGTYTSGIFNLPGSGGAAPVITSATSATATVGTPFSYTITASGTPTSYAADNLSGTGLSINTSTGVISGTPTAAGAITTHLTATNASGTSPSVTLTITVASGASAPTVTSATTASATVGTPFSYTITATGSPTSYSADNLTGTGLSVNTSTGVISGTPTTVGNITTHLSATNAAGTSPSVTLTITVAAASGTAPTISNQSASGTQNSTFSYQVVATGATSYSVVGTPALPAGLTLNTATGKITGTPTVAGTTAVTIQATNANGSKSATLTITINAPSSGGGGVVIIMPPPPVMQSQTISFSAPVSAIIVGQPVSLGATASSGLPITYTIVSGNATLNGTALVLKDTNPVVVRAAQAGNGTYSPATSEVTFTAQKAAQSINVSGTSFSVPAEAPVKLAATASSGLPVTYTIVSGPATISGGTLTFTGTGPVVVRAAQTGDGTYNAASPVTITYTAIPITRLINISTRLRVDASQATIAGFVVTGSAPKQMLIRAVGPGLSQFGIATPLADPQLKLFDSKGAVVASNNDWGNDAAISAAAGSVGAFALANNSKDAALLVTLAPGAYTAQVTGATNGTVLIEVYDASAAAAVPTKQLINISTRGLVGTGDDAVITGFVVAGSQPKRVLIRAVGPGLAPFGVSGTLSDPMIKLMDSKNTLVAQNQKWGTPVGQGAASASDIAAAATAAGAFPLASGSNDASVLITLNPGSYTAIVTGASNGTGAALVEVYEVPTP